MIDLLDWVHFASYLKKGQLVLSICFLTLFFGYTCGTWKFLGQGLDMRHGSASSQCSDNAGSLTHCTTRKLHDLFSYLFLKYHKIHLFKVYNLLVLIQLQSYATVTTVFCFFFLFLFRTSPTAYGGSQARGQIGAVAASLRHNHSNARSELSLWPTPQLTAMPDP